MGVKLSAAQAKKVQTAMLGATHPFNPNNPDSQYVPTDGTGPAAKAANAAYYAKKRSNTSDGGTVPNKYSKK